MKSQLALWQFKLKLVISLGLFVVQLTLITVPKSILLLGSGAVGGALLILVLLLTKPETTILETPLYKASPLPHSELYERKTLTQEELQKELEYWKKVEEKQPTHRDVLINIALLSQTLGHEEQYQEYWQKAKTIDPNNELFVGL